MFGLKIIVLRPLIMYGLDRISGGSTAGITRPCEKLAVGQKHTIPFRGTYLIHPVTDISHFHLRALLDPPEENYSVFNLPGERMEINKIVKILNNKYGEGLIDGASLEYDTQMLVDFSKFEKTFGKPDLKVFEAMC